MQLSLPTHSLRFPVILVSANPACEELVRHGSRAMWACGLQRTFKGEPIESDLKIRSGPHDM